MTSSAGTGGVTESVIGPAETVSLEMATDASLTAPPPILHQSNGRNAIIIDFFEDEWTR
jgi:hypothetical protein